MSAIYRSAMLFLCVLCFSTTLSAQDETRIALQKSSPVITAAAADGKFRFSSPAGVAHIRVQILSASADTVFDSAWKDGNVLDWPIESPGQPLTDGLYRCVVMVSDLEGQVTQKDATFAAHGGQVSIEPRAGTDGLTIIGTDGKGPKITMLAHDGENGSIVSTSGDLSFRFGNFLAGKDSEKMRLTAEGNLGIGTDKPQAPLDVNGLIRTSKGIMFSDGTILATAAGLPGVTGSGEVIPGRPVAPVIVRGGFEPMSPTRSGSPNGRTPRTAAGPDYQFKVDNLGVHIGTTNAFGLDVAGNVNLSSNLALPVTASAAAGVITQSGTRLLHTFGGQNVFLGSSAGNFTMTGAFNTAIGTFALVGNTSGATNTASGVSALQNNTTGSRNTANGANASVVNTTGGGNTASGESALFFNTADNNTASGAGALYKNTTGTNNTASGKDALLNNTIGSSNMASGKDALFNNTTGSNNTASGFAALYNNGGGSGNIAVGAFAGQNLNTGGNNIYIGNQGPSVEAGTIRIGTGGTQTKTFIAGISGVTTALTAVPVLVDSNGQLGTASSSRRYKFDISDMDRATDGLMHLRPVTFRYLAHGDHAPLQYGLIAEEVNDVYPELVAKNKDGEVETVMYQFLAPMLLNEVQKQHRQIEEQQKTIDALGQRLEALESQAARGK
jgi:hypothetical protein